MNDTIDFVISTGGGKASYKAEQPGTDAQIIASARAFLEDFCEMEMNEEIPVALMIYDAAKYTALPASGLF